MTPPLRARASHFLWLTVLLTLFPLTSWSTEPQAVYVLEHGGVEVVQTFSPGVSAGQRSISRGTLRVRPSLAQAQTIEDMRALSDGRLLLGGVGGRNVEAVDPATLETQVLFAARSEISRLDTIAVASTSAFGDPQRLLMADAGTGVVLIEDLLLERSVWAQRFFMPGGIPDFAQAIALPGDVVVIATTWNGLNIHTIDVVQLNEPAPMNTTRLASAPNPNHPPQTIILPELMPLRDVFAISADRLIVTTQFEILEINQQGDIAWRIRMADDLTLGGEFAGARLTPNGGLAVTTFEPGFWVRPHPNHRVHWFDMSALPPTRTLSSGALARAPKRVASVDFVGASGTFNQSGDIEGELDGQASDLTLSQGPTLTSQRVSVMDVLGVGFSLANQSPRNIALQKVGMFATRGDTCGAPGQPAQVLYDQGPTIVGPMETLEVSNAVAFEADQPLDVGSWCVQVRAQDTQGQWEDFTPTIQLEVVPRSERPKQQVPKSDLRLSNEDMSADLGDMSSDMTDNDDTQEPQEGCGCASAPHDQPPWATLLLFLGALLMLRTRQRLDD